MSLFELEKTLSFDEYIGSFDTERVEKVRGFVDWPSIRAVLSIILGVR
jgi:hypothetical protein